MGGLVRAVAFQDADGLAVSDASIDRYNGPAFFQLVSVVFGLFLGNAKSYQSAGDPCDGAACRRAGQNGGQGASGNRRSDGRQQAGDHGDSPEGAHAEARRAAGSGPSARMSLGTLGRCMGFRLLVPAGNADVFVIKSCLSQVLDGVPSLLIVPEDADRGCAF